jgi:hypothetical protein
MAGKRYPCEVKYEKIGQLCFACGLLGHSFKECGDGVFDEATLKFGDFVYVTPLGRGRGSSSFKVGLRSERGGGPLGGGRGDANLPPSSHGRGAEGRGREAPPTMIGVNIRNAMQMAPTRTSLMNDEKMTRRA